MQDAFTIIKNDHLGREVWRYPGRLISRSEKGLLFEAHFNRSDLDFNGLLLKQNDRFLELYPFDKYFNIYEIYDRDSGLCKGWYCNVTRPIRIMDASISYDDLALDLLVFPDGRQLVLDEDEFAELNLDAGLKEKALKGLGELRRIFRDLAPFDVHKLI
jgi:predicted RNA-binding protein associated with RNAse of E/G family